MTTSRAFKVWVADRSRYTELHSECSIDDVIEKASAELDVVGWKLVLEEDGTVVDEDSVFQHYATLHDFVLLGSGQYWTPADQVACADWQLGWRSSAAAEHIDATETVHNAESQVKRCTERSDTKTLIGSNVDGYGTAMQPFNLVNPRHWEIYLQATELYNRAAMRPVRVRRMFYRAAGAVLVTAGGSMALMATLKRLSSLETGM